MRQANTPPPLQRKNTILDQAHWGALGVTKKEKPGREMRVA